MRERNVGVEPFTALTTRLMGGELSPGVTAHERET
jgi:hypothetical protein